MKKAMTKAKKLHGKIALEMALHAARTEIARCHARLEIDHAWKYDGTKMVRFTIPMDQRARFPDGISCRDETIKLLQRNVDELRKSPRPRASRKVSDG